MRNDGMPPPFSPLNEGDRGISVKLFLIFFTGIPISNIEQGISNYEAFLSFFCFAVFTLVTKIEISSLFS